VKSKKAPAKDVLKDLVEMCRGVQHPTRGLFLRTYLSEMMKDKLPEEGSEYYGWGGDVNDSIQFIITNFIEMNKLWVRMQYQASGRDRERRERERREMATLVGQNLQRLAQLEGIDANKYKDEILPKILEQIIQCNDKIAQQHLTEMVTQAFSDEFHIQTLELFLRVCSRLHQDVDIEPIVIPLIQRLSKHIASHKERFPLSNNDVYRTFLNELPILLRQRINMPLESMISVLDTLVHFAIDCYPENIQLVDNVLKECLELIILPGEALSPKAVKATIALLHTPLKGYNNILKVLALTHYGEIMNMLKWPDKKRVAVDIIQNVLENNTLLSKSEDVSKLLELIKPLLVDSEGQEVGYLGSEAFTEEQHLVARLIHCFESDDIENAFASLVVAKKILDNGGPYRLPYTSVPLVFKSLRVIQRLRMSQDKDNDWTRKASKVFKFVHDTLKTLITSQQNVSPVVPSATTTLPAVSRTVRNPFVIALNLNVQTALEADQCNLGEITNDFFSKAWIIYEDEIADSKEQYDCVRVIIGALQVTKSLSEAQYSDLTKKTAQYAAKLLRKPDQSNAVAMCSHLFWNKSTSANENPDTKHVLECLKQSFKIAESCMDTTVNAQLYVDLLNEWLYYFEENPNEQAKKYVNGLIKLVKQTFASSTTNKPEVVTHFDNTLKHIRIKQKTDEHYRAIELD